MGIQEKKRVSIGAGRLRYRRLVSRRGMRKRPIAYSIRFHSKMWSVPQNFMHSYPLCLPKKRIRAKVI
jgi:hypothetical protein